MSLRERAFATAAGPHPRRFPGRVAPLPLHPTAVRRPAVPAADRPSAYLTVLMFLTLSYHLWLSFIYTHAGLAGNAPVIAAEAVLVAASLPLMIRRVQPWVCLVAMLMMANAFVLAMLRESFDPKPLRDLLVPLVFLWVGMNAAGEAAAGRLLRRAIWLVLGFALFEFVLLEPFTRLFDIQSYYVARGVADPQMTLYRDDKLVASGMRPEDIGRTLLPFLGPHRASSVFVEPVSLGNFAVICAAWGLARERWREGVFFIAAAAAMVVLADSRFGLVSIGLLILLRVMLIRGSEPLAMAFPLLGAAALVLLAGSASGTHYTDDFLGRLSRSGDMLVAMDLPQLLGAHPDVPPYYDMGYSYVLANFGLVAALLLWAAFWLLPVATAPGRRFRVFVALYLTLILCVSGTSVFAFKTSAMLWFLLGSLTARPSPAAEPQVGHERGG